MRVIGVLDLLGGRAVHARAGQRERYRPVRAVAGEPIGDGDPLALARAYIDRLGVSELYAADLDAILGRTPQDALVARLAATGAPLWLDAGVSSGRRARQVLAVGATRVVVGLETLPSWDALRAVSDEAGGDRVAFSLDLANGEPIFSSAAGATIPGEAADRVAARAAWAGVGGMIVIDLARVGTGRGPDTGLIARMRDVAPGLTLVGGGGIRGLEDLRRLAAAGCDGALVATALHDGRLDGGGVAAAGRLPANACIPPERKETGL